MTPAHVLGYVALGVAVGAVGTLIGAGGGFVLVPVLDPAHARRRAVRGRRPAPVSARDV